MAHTSRVAVFNHHRAARRARIKLTREGVVVGEGAMGDVERSGLGEDRAAGATMVIMWCVVKIVGK